MSEKALKVVMLISVIYLALGMCLGSCGALTDDSSADSSEKVPWADDISELNEQNEEDGQIEGSEQNDQNLSETSKEDEKKNLVSLVYSEGWNQSDNLNLAIAAVVINRVRNPDFPNSITDVIFQPNQFISVYTNTLVDYENIPVEERNQVESAVESALLGKDPTNGAFFYYEIKDINPDENVRIMTTYHCTEIDRFVFLRKYPYN